MSKQRSRYGRYGLLVVGVAAVTGLVGGWFLRVVSVCLYIYMFMEELLWLQFWRPFVLTVADVTEALERRVKDLERRLDEVERPVKEMELCPECNRRPPLPGKVHCQICADYLLSKRMFP